MCVVGAVSEELRNGSEYLSFQSGRSNGALKGPGPAQSQTGVSVALGVCVELLQNAVYLVARQQVAGAVEWTSVMETEDGEGISVLVQLYSQKLRSACLEEGKGFIILADRPNSSLSSLCSPLL